jgi:hypothetical protein
MKTFEAQLVRPPGVGTWTFVTAPFCVEEVYGKRGRVAVKGKIDGQPFQGSLMPHGDGRHFIVVKKEIREAIGKEAGATVRVELELDTEARVVKLPEAFARALDRRKKVKAAFHRLSYTHRKEYADWIAGAKKAETQERRIQQAIDRIASGTRVQGS